MPNPIHAAVDATKADLPNLPTGATASTTFPSDSALSHVHVQVGWDGTPTFSDNREDTSMRFTVWAPLGQQDVAIDEAEGLLVRLLSATSSTFYRIDRGSGRLSGVDPDTGLPFCTFNLGVVMHALTS